MPRNIFFLKNFRKVHFVQSTLVSNQRASQLILVLKCWCQPEVVLFGVCKLLIEYFHILVPPMCMLIFSIFDIFSLGVEFFFRSVDMGHLGYQSIENFLDFNNVYRLGIASIKIFFLQALQGKKKGIFGSIFKKLFLHVFNGIFFRIWFPCIERGLKMTKNELI